MWEGWCCLRIFIEDTVGNSMAFNEALLQVMQWWVLLAINLMEDQKRIKKIPKNCEPKKIQWCHFILLSIQWRTLDFSQKMWNNVLSKLLWLQPVSPSKWNSWPDRICNPIELAALLQSLLTCFAIGIIWMKYFSTRWRSLSRTSKNKCVSGSIIRGLPSLLNPPRQCFRKMNQTVLNN